MTSSSVFQSADGCLNLRCQVRQDGSSVLPARLHWYRDGVMVAGYGYHGDGADFPTPDMYRMTREGLKMCGGSPERSAGECRSFLSTVFSCTCACVCVCVCVRVYFCVVVVHFCANMRFWREWVEGTCACTCIRMFVYISVFVFCIYGFSTGGLILN